MVSEGGSFQKDKFRINRQRVPETRAGIREGMIREFKLGCKGWTVGETEVVGETSFNSRFDIDKIAHRDWFRYMQEIVSNRYDFVLYAI